MPPSVAEPCVFSVRVSAEGAAAFPLPPFANCKGFVPELKNILRILLLLLLLFLLFIVVVALVVKEEKVLFPAENPRPKYAMRLDLLSLLIFSSRENDARPPLPSSLLLRMASEDAKKGRLVPITSLPLPLAAEPEKSVDVKKEEHKDEVDQTLFLEDEQNAEENAATARRWERIRFSRSFVFPKKISKRKKLLRHESNEDERSRFFLTVDCFPTFEQRPPKKNEISRNFFVFSRAFSFSKSRTRAHAQRVRERERERERRRRRKKERSRSNEKLFSSIYVLVGNVD